MSNDPKPDFSNVLGSARSTDAAHPDFSNVQSRTTSTERINEGGGGGTGTQTYTVVAGDNLSRIAKHFYGKPHWQPIFDANRDQLDDPDRIYPGQVLRIPAHEA